MQFYSCECLCRYGTSALTCPGTYITDKTVLPVMTFYSDLPHEDIYIQFMQVRNVIFFNWYESHVGYFFKDSTLGRFLCWWTISTRWYHPPNRQCCCTDVIIISSLRHRWPYPILAFLFMSFDFIAPQHLLFSILIVPYEGYSRN